MIWCYRYFLSTGYILISTVVSQQFLNLDFHQCSSPLDAVSYHDVAEPTSPLSCDTIFGIIKNDNGDLGGTSGLCRCDLTPYVYCIENV